MINQSLFLRGAQRATWYNSGEINMVVETIKSLLSEKHLCSPPLRPADIGVMTPWREQVWKLRERLRKESLRAVDVGNIEVCCCHGCFPQY